MHDGPLYLGIDLGTGGVRALLVSATGEVVAQQSVPFGRMQSSLPAGHHEQDATHWWDVTRAAVIQLREIVREMGIAKEAIAAVAVDGTSGTVVGVDEQGEPVGPGLMYNDGRAVAEARELAAMAAVAGPSPSGQIAASYAIAKILWMHKHEPAAFARTRWFMHQADFIAAKLTGRWGITDYSNALKTGFDLVAGDWPAWMAGHAQIRKRLPQVVAPGQVIGTVSSLAGAMLGLSTRMRVVAGASDGTAGFIASGAHAVGHINTTLGTTLVFKQLAAGPVFDPRGLIYCHKLPGMRDADARGRGHGHQHEHARDLWLPGAASNTGCEWMSQRFGNFDFAECDGQAVPFLPCDRLVYPLARTGERFPFLSPKATGFTDDSLVTASPASAYFDYAAHLQGVALVERLCYEALDQACGNAAGALPAPIYATGGGSRSDIWMQLRADVTGRVYHRPACPESAFGAAILAATPDHGSLPEAVRNMVRIERTFEPDVALRDRYDALFETFKNRLEDHTRD